MAKSIKQKIVAMSKEDQEIIKQRTEELIHEEHSLRELRLMSKLSTLKKQMLSNKETEKAYDEMSLEFGIAKRLIAERLKAKMTQEDVAAIMGTSQSAIARTESGNSLR